MALWEQFTLTVLQGLGILLFSPLLAGVINKLKARLQARRGPRLLQPYYDLIKYFRKEAVVSEHASWLTVAAPYIVFAATLVSGLLLPLAGSESSIGGDFLLFVYLLALARFFTAIAALDAGSAFGGMGASREMALNTVIEPAFLLAALSIMLQTGTTRFSGILTAFTQDGATFFSLPYVLVLFALLLVILAETGRIPVDNPDTHLELTMIHEGMLLEYSGRYLGLMVYSGMMKQFVIAGLFVTLFLPFGQPDVTGWGSAAAGAGLLLLKILALGALLAVIEMVYAKVRLYHVPKLFVTSMTLSLLAIVVNLLF